MRCKTLPGLRHSTLLHPDQGSPEMIGSSDTVPIASTFATVSHSPWSHFRCPSSTGQQEQHPGRYQTTRRQEG